MGVMVNVPDHVQYFSWYWDYTRANLAIDRLTPEPNGPVFFNLLWWMLGRLGGALGVGYEVMFQVLRVVATLTFLIAAVPPQRLVRAGHHLRRRTAFLVTVCWARLRLAPDRVARGLQSAAADLGDGR